MVRNMSKRSRSSTIADKRPFKRARTSTISKAEVLKIVRANSDKRQCINRQLGTIDKTGVATATVVMTRGDNMQNQYAGAWANWSWMRFRSLFTVATSDEQDSLRQIIVQWKGLAPTTFTPGVVLDLQNSVEPILAPYSVVNRSLFTVLSDTTHCVSLNTPEIVTNIFIPGKRLLKTGFLRTTDAVQSGQVYVILVSNSSLAPSPTVEWTLEGYFTDDL